MKYELKPCPFCGSTTAPTIMTREEADWMCDPEEREMYDGEIPMVVCCAAKKGGCGASTGFCNDDEGNFGRQAAEAWNRRAPDWIPVSERLPENCEPVNIVWTNHSPASYYSHIKDKLFTATGICYNGKWHWYSCVCEDNLEEYGRCEMDEVAEEIEILFWMPLPEPPEEREEDEENE